MHSCGPLVLFNRSWFSKQRETQERTKNLMESKMKCLWVMCTKSICGPMWINTLDQHLSWQSVESQLIFTDTSSVDRNMSQSTLSQLLTDCQLTAVRDVDWISIKVSVKMLIECLWKVLIDTQLQMPLILLHDPIKYQYQMRVQIWNTLIYL